MSKHKGLFWLSSYPKSGNTWFRIFLANLLAEPGETVDLHKLSTDRIASSRYWLDETLGIDSALLSHDEIDVRRPNVYKHSSLVTNEIGYHKIHDAYTYVANRPLIPTEGCLGVIYFIRNPLDVAISFAHHSACTIDQAIKDMENPSFALSAGKFKQYLQIRQHLLTWSMHVQSWVEAKNLNLLVLRYEDMKQYPLESFTKATQFLQLDFSQDAIKKSIAATTFDKLQQAEALQGFNEKPSSASCFFRKGIVDDWKTTLSPVQIEKIIHAHGEVMQRFGYLY